MLSLVTRFLGGVSVGSWQVHSRAAGLGESNRDRLLGVLRAMLAFANMMEFLTYELASLRRRRFPRLLISLSARFGVLVWHHRSRV
jgi:hypothetical protein